MNKKLNITKKSLLAGGLLSSLLIVLSLFVVNRQPSRLKLKENEVLFVFLTTNQHFAWKSEEINWYKVEKDYHLIVDIKGDPTTAYFPFDNIATWGIER